MSVLVHYVICTYISPPTSAMVEEAVYPAQLGDIETPPILVGEDSSETKEVITKEKDLGL